MRSLVCAERGPSWTVWVKTARNESAIAYVVGGGCPAKTWADFKGSFGDDWKRRVFNAMQMQ